VITTSSLKPYLINYPLEKFLEATASTNTSITNSQVFLKQQEEISFIGLLPISINIMELLLIKSASSTMKPSSGTTVRQHFGKKSSCKFDKGIELDFYPSFSCCKPKFKWNLTKFDFSQQDLSGINSFTLIAKNTPIHSMPPSGKPLSRTTNLRSSTQSSTPSPLLNPMPRVENPSIRPNLPEFRLCQIISTFKLITGTALIPLQTLPWREPLELVPLYLNTNDPENSSLHPQLLPSIVVVELIFVTVITTNNQELLLLHPISFSGIHESLADP